MHDWTRTSSFVPRCHWIRKHPSCFYQKFREYLDKKEIPMEKIAGIATDGAAAMVGKKSGFVRQLK